MTICCVHNDTHILLGEIIKEGKLKGMYNGFGGKVEQGETIEEAAKRELWEECQITPLDMFSRGIIEFSFEENGNPFDGKPTLEVHVFSVTRFEGEPTETNEMRPRWFLHGEIPFDKMWPDDPYWMPLLLAGKNFKGKFYLKNTKEIISYDLCEI